MPRDFPNCPTIRLSGYQRDSKIDHKKYPFSPTREKDVPISVYSGVPIPVPIRLSILYAMLCVGVGRGGGGIWNNCFTWNNVFFLENIESSRNCFIWKNCVKIIHVHYEETFVIQKTWDWAEFWLKVVETTLIKKKIKFSSYIRKFRIEQLQSHIWLF